MAVVLFMISSHTAPAAAQQKIFRGLTTMAVIIEPIGQDLTRRDVTVEKLKGEIEAKLKTAGIKITDDTSAPYLCLSIGIVQVSDRTWAVGIDLALRETVQLARDTSRSVFASTWKTGGLMKVDMDDLPKVRDYVLTYIDDFVADYLATNQKVPPAHMMPKKP